eukprot:COSAG02_NODE_5773_length_4049_cov_2.289873_1_plen_119_part_00
MFVTELCVLRTFGGVDFSLIFVCAQSVPEFLWDRLRASIQFPVMPKRAQYARFSGQCVHFNIMVPFECPWRVEEFRSTFFRRCSHMCIILFKLIERKWYFFPVLCIVYRRILARRCEN